MPMGSASTASRNSGKVSHDHGMPASIACGEISSAISRLEKTLRLSSSAQGASVKPQLPITTEVTPCQQLLEPIRSQNTWAS